MGMSTDTVLLSEKLHLFLVSMLFLKECEDTTLTLFVWTCVALVYVSGLVLGLASMVIALLGVAVLVTYSPQNGLILLLIAFLISPYGLPKLAFWMLSKVQGLKYTIQNFVYG